MELRILNSKDYFSPVLKSTTPLLGPGRRRDSLETYQEFLSAIKGAVSFEDLAVRVGVGYICSKFILKNYGYNSFTLLGLGPAYSSGKKAS